MGQPWHSVLALVTLVLPFFLVLLLRLKRRTGAATSDFLPPGPWAWPIIGHLPLLAVGCPHHTLALLSRKHGYGAFLGLRLGSQPTVVACSAAAAKELLLTHDKAFANRPHWQAIDHLLYGYDNGVAFSSYCPRWTKLRKIYTLDLFTAKRLQQLQHVRQGGVRGLLQRLRQASGNGMRAIPLVDFFGEMSSHTMSRLLHSKTLSEAGGDSFPNLLREVEHALSPTLGDLVPGLKCLDFLQLHRMRAIHARIDKVLNTILSGRQRAVKGMQAHELPHDFLQVLLSKEASSNDENTSLIQDDELLSTEQVKASMLDILGGGIHTTAVTLEWAMAELLRSPNRLRKLQDEIDATMSKKRPEELVRDEHLAELPYLENVVKEVLRLHPPFPLLFPRMSSIETKVDRYTLPARTQVLVNVWAIGRDPRVWEKAEEFIPERFEGKDMDMKGKHFDLLPFGGGRRICPGMRLGLSMVHVALANLVWTFDWDLPLGQTPFSLDMSEKRGISCCKGSPLLAIPKFRQSSA